ncbi:MAG: UDP-glucose 4-epimerase GalE, partial [Pontimonas sp.]
GHDVVVIDDLSAGRAEVLPEGVVLVRGSVTNPGALDEAFSHGVDGVIHFAGFKHAGVSVEKPLLTYDQNVVGMLRLVEAMERAGVVHIVFSSTSAVYGDVDAPVIHEDAPKNPASPYGQSKLVGEWILRDQGVATGLKHCSLRYFNVVGSGVTGIYDTSPYSLLSMVFAALDRGDTPQVFGTDYDTPDGTCIRDYIHVQALADAHVSVAEKLLAGEPLLPAYNLGSGTGSSVAQMMAEVATATGIAFEPQAQPRRAGDPMKVVASGAAAARDVGWVMTQSVSEMVGSAWREFATVHGVSPK